MRQKDQTGVTLIEVLIAMIVTVVGVVAVATLITYGIGLQVLSRDTSRANSLAKAKIEQLRIIPSSDPQLSLGGDLSSNVSDHFDTPAGFVRRWVVAAGPPRHPPWWTSECCWRSKCLISRIR
jgi:Tfp pilus assembly protein PilV